MWLAAAAVLGLFSVGAEGCAGGGISRLDFHQSVPYQASFSISREEKCAQFAPFRTRPRTWRSSRMSS